ncbi:MAG: hypothetical protein J0L92_23590 [Deltaproteobacteria bacterium]|nr:hypothetical protein [Deltaproteobacteria bacterium]
MRITTYTRRPFLLAAFVLAACPSTREIGPDAPSDVGFDAGPPEANGLDLLFMIDNSCPMAEEQVNLVADLPHLFVALSTGDVDGDGDRELGPIASLHVGVVTSDMGAGPHEGVPTCGRGLGDDGILRARSRLTTGPCRAVYPSGVFEFMPLSETSADTHASTMGCVANVGTGGCGFEQQLESALKAVTPSQRNAGTAEGYVPPRFVSAEGVPDVESGQADRANAGFVRRDSALAIVLVTDEDDCSVRDYGLYVSGDPRFSGTPLNLRCRRFGSPEQGVVHPVSRYVEGFLGLRRDPRTLAFSVITGVPPSAIDEGAEVPDFDRILTDPNMIPTENAEGTNVNPACSTDNGVAYPPIRLVETARGLHAAGAQVSVSSLCASTFRPAIDQFLVSLAPIFPPR